VFVRAKASHRVYDAATAAFLVGFMVLVLVDQLLVV